MADMTKPAAQPRAKRGEGPRTEYVILQRKPPRGLGEEGWQVVDDIAASSVLAAVREAYGQHRQEGLYVAVPKRSWRPIEVKVERTERLIVGPYNPSKQAAKQETEPEGQFDGDGMEREATPENPDVDPLRPIEPFDDGRVR